MDTIFTTCLLSVTRFMYQTLLGLFFLYILLTTTIIILSLKTSFWDSRFQLALLPTVPKYFFGHMPLNSDGNPNVALVSLVANKAAPL